MDDSTNIIDFRQRTGKPIPPPNPTPHRLVQRRRPLAEETPWEDPELEEMLGFPVRVPNLRRQVQKEKKEEDQIEKEIDLMQKYREKPLLFWKDELGIPINIWPNDKPPRDWEPGDPVPLWSKQREIINALVQHRKVAVKSGHGVGKTFLAAGLSLYLGLVWHATGMTTAPTFRQVRRALWGEVHYIYNRARRPLGGKINQVSLDLGDKWFIEGFATDKPTDNITGIHEENIFVIVDEAGGVLPETFEALDALLTSESSFVLYIGNPVSSDGPFYEAFQPGSGFKTFTLSCYDSPNVKHNRNIYPKLTSKRWVDEKEKKWGKGSALFKIRVEGEFADESRDTLIPIKYLDLAFRKSQENIVTDKILTFALDVSRQGSDTTVFGAKYSCKNRPETLFRILDITTRKRETETAGRMKRMYDEFIKGFTTRMYRKAEQVISRAIGKEEEEIDQNEWPPINIDEINVGGGVIDILMEEGYPVNSVNVSEPPDESNMEEVKTFLNKRAVYFWKLKKIFEDEMIIVEDEDVIFELSKFRFEMLRSGKIKMIDKAIIKKELKDKSPDKADDCMLAYAVEEANENRELIRFL